MVLAWPTAVSLNREPGALSGMKRPGLDRSRFCEATLLANICAGPRGEAMRSRAVGFACRWVAWPAVVLVGTGLPGLVGLSSAAAAPWEARSAVGQAAARAVPAAPFVVSVSGVGLGVLVDWAPNPRGEDLTSYSVTAAPAARSKTKACPAPRAVTVSAAPADTAAVVGGLCASVVYRVRAVAVNSAGRSAPSSASAPVVPLTAQPPDPPLIVSVTARNTTLLVNWSRPAYGGGRPVTGYRLRATHGSQVVTVRAAAKATSATVTGLT